MSLSKPSVQNIPTWRVYPRVHYFQRRYNELLPRFRRVIGSFPKSFQDDKKLKDIASIDEQFSCSWTLVTSGEIKFENIVSTTKPMQEKLTDYYPPSKLTIFVSHFVIQNTDTTVLKQVKENIDLIEERFKPKHPDLFDSFFIVVDTSSSTDDDDFESLPSLDSDFKTKFRNEICTYISIKQNGNAWDHEERIIFGSHDSAVASVISVYLEAKLVDGYHKVMAYLERFVRVNKGFASQDIDILHSDLVVRAIQGLIRDDIGLADMRKIAEQDESEETKGWTPDEKFIHQLLKKLARLIKCSIVEPCSAKFNIPSWIVNLLLVELNFESKLIEGVSKNTRYHLRKLKDVSENYDEIVGTHKRKGNMGAKHGASQHERFVRYVSYKFDFVIYPIQNDISKVVSDAEKTMASACRMVVIMEKMIFEIEGYLEQTIVEKFEPKTPTPIIPKGLRKEIEKLEDVYGVGVIYNTLEVHINPFKKEPDIDDVATEKGKTVENVVESAVKELLLKHGYKYPYKVKVVSQQPVQLMADVQHENGKLIKSPCPNKMTEFREGTLGAFVVDKDKRLFALTCAHVVCNENVEEHDVYIQADRRQMRKLGVCTRKLTLCSGSVNSPLVDLAAVKVADEIQGHCIRRMKDECGLNRQSRIADEDPSQLVKLNVYKYGAKSDFTRGIICSSGFSRKGNSEESYVLLIESLPGDVTHTFAARGDSGAVICMPDINSDSIKVVSMLSAGDYKLENESMPLFMSFLMKTGLEKMRDKSDIAFDIP